MEKIGLIAGGGTLPAEFIKSAKKNGEKVIVFAIEDMASKDLKKEADKVYWLKVGQYRKFAFLLLKERIRRIALLGKVDKSVIYDQSEYDEEARLALKNLKDKKDYSILEEVTKHLKRFGVEVVDSTTYLSHLLPEKGVLTKKKPGGQIEKDIKFGYNAAKQMAGMDVGQTVVVKDGTVVAVEAMEGTDATIERALETAGSGCVMVKVSRPDQDLRWDVPTVGPETVRKLSEGAFSALAIESGKMFLIEKEKMISLADELGIVVEVL